jgi:hypothetical protein
MIITVALLLFCCVMGYLFVSSAAEMQRHHDANKDREDP